MYVIEAVLLLYFRLVHAHSVYLVVVPDDEFIHLNLNSWEESETNEYSTLLTRALISFMQRSLCKAMLRMDISACILGTQLFFTAAIK
jgi:hypothetical protein